MHKQHMESLLKQIPGLSLTDSDLVGLQWGLRISSQRILTLTSMDHMSIYMTCVLLNFPGPPILKPSELFFFSCMWEHHFNLSTFFCFHPLSIDFPLHTPKIPLFISVFIHRSSPEKLIS